MDIGNIDIFAFIQLDVISKKKYQYFYMPRSWKNAKILIIIIIVTKISRRKTDNNFYTTVMTKVKSIFEFPILFSSNIILISWIIYRSRNGKFFKL